MVDERWLGSFGVTRCLCDVKYDTSASHSWDQCHTHCIPLVMLAPAVPGFKDMKCASWQNSGQINSTLYLHHYSLTVKTLCAC